MKEKLIIWDWNGTLLDDVTACVESMNIMLKARKMNPITPDKYKDIFTFPVQKYYERLGFDFKQESFEELSIEYIDLYKQCSADSPLQPRTIESLSFFDSEQYSQVIVSASEQTALIKQVEDRQIYSYFDSLIGLDNIHAKSKLQNALNYIQNSQIETENIILVGDTYHDYEVASAIGCKCVLVNNGHQALNQRDINGLLQIIHSLEKLPELMMD